MKSTLKKLFLTQLFFIAMVWGGGPSALANPVESSTDKTPATRRSTGVAVRYKCVQNGDKYSTMALTERGPIEIIVWEQKPNENISKLAERCQTVSQRFQDFAEKGYLKFLNIGQMNNENVICATTETGKEGCLPDGLLITLEPKDNPLDLLEKLFYSHLPPAKGGPRRTDGKPIDFQQLLRERPPLPQSASTLSTSDGLSKPVTPVETLPDTPEQPVPPGLPKPW